MINEIIVFAPIILAAACIPSIYRRAGFPKNVRRFMWLPTILAISSLAAVVSGERGVFVGPLGTWAIAAALLMLVLIDWPRKVSRN
ncbi:hypothetical protein B0E33_18640 [Roseibium algicola]|uniref:Uncharacterized protein n=1 Tax=Roseibium algicola TaxID=2857014 RepID=A0ABN4WW66_9HYPH|nr:hypothetical protein B0E33_18640 [Roseibium aggregatum]